MVENSQFCQFAERVYCLAKDMEKYFLNPFVNERGQLLDCISVCMSVEVASGLNLRLT